MKRHERGAHASLRALYRELDRAVQRLREVHGVRLQCAPGCASCCVDGLTVFEAEALHIAERNRDLLRAEAPHGPGACAFLNGERRCRIYRDRPYVCRTQGLPLRWLEEDAQEGIVELRDICPKNEAGIPIEDLPEDACWTIGPAEGQLALFQSSLPGGEMRRTALRDLFGMPRRTTRDQ